MREPTEAELDAIEATPGAIEVQVPEAGAWFALRPLTFAEVRDLCDGGRRDDANAPTRAVMAALLWPSRDEFRVIVDAFSGAMGRAVRELEYLAGHPPPERRPSWSVLSSQTTDETLAELGVPVDAARAALAKFPHPGQLEVCRLPHRGLSLLVRRPSVANLELLGRTKDPAVSYFDATLDLAIDCIVWPAPPEARAALLANPALHSLTLAQRLVAMGNGEVRHVGKAFTRRGKRRAN